ncbi:transposase [Hydrogenimonas sp.]
MRAPSFFDYAMQNQGGKRTRKFLAEMKAYIPYDRLEALLIKEGVYRPKHPGQPGRPPYRSSVLLGALFLQAWYDLSDPMTEELIYDRLSFREFLDIQEDDDIPDETTICNFRNALMEKGLFEKIFEIIQEVMQAHDLILKEGSIVDATLIHSSEPKRKRDEQGGIVSNKAHDPDATNTAKRGKSITAIKCM